MNTLAVLNEAFAKRHQISFQYNKEGKIQGIRVGNPYAVFIFTAKNTRIQSTKVHIVQTEGVSDTETEKPFPSFRMYNIEDLSDVTILIDKPLFIPSLEHGQDKAITTDILNTAGDFGGKAQASEVNSASLTTPFTYDKKDQYLPVTKEVSVSNNKITYSFPAHSFTQIKVSVKEK